MLNTNGVVFNFLLDVVVLDIDMFCVTVVLGVFCTGFCCCVVFVDGCGLFLCVSVVSFCCGWSGSEWVGFRDETGTNEKGTIECNN